MSLPAKVPQPQTGSSATSTLPRPDIPGRGQCHLEVDGPPAGADQIAERFDWSPPMAAAISVVNGGNAADLYTRDRDRLPEPDFPHVLGAALRGPAGGAPWHHQRRAGRKPPQRGDVEMVPVQVRDQDDVGVLRDVGLRIGPCRRSGPSHLLSIGSVRTETPSSRSRVVACPM